MPYLELQGTQLFYECQGDGSPPLVFVHGYACSHDDWQKQVDFFRTQQYVVTCDLRGTPSVYRCAEAGIEFKRRGCLTLGNAACRLVRKEREILKRLIHESPL